MSQHADKSSIPAFELFTPVATSWNSSDSFSSQNNFMTNTPSVNKQWNDNKAATDYIDKKNEPTQQYYGNTTSHTATNYEKKYEPTQQNEYNSWWSDATASTAYTSSNYEQTQQTNNLDLNQNQFYSNDLDEVYYALDNYNDEVGDGVNLTKGHKIIVTN